MSEFTINANKITYLRTVEASESMGGKSEESPKFIVPFGKAARPKRAGKTVVDSVVLHLGEVKEVFGTYKPSVQHKENVK